jgi:cell division protein FtsW (lipid II flippase)
MFKSHLSLLFSQHFLLYSFFYYCIDFLFLFFSYFDYRSIAKSGRYLYVFLFISLLTVLKFGKTVQGSARWFDLKLFSFQPAEIAKLVLILVLNK